MVDFIFKKNSLGNLEFKGDFNSLYLDDIDPWGQSGDDSNHSMSFFYNRSREILCQNIKMICNQECNNELKICEVGSGIGYVTKKLSDELPENLIVGVDISDIAITKAREKFPSLNFETHNILHRKLNNKFNVIILSNIIWYVIHDFNNLINNVLESMDKNNNRYLVIHNALFKKNQIYATDIVSTIGDMLNLFMKALEEKVIIQKVNSDFIRHKDMEHDFGLISIKF